MTFYGHWRGHPIFSEGEDWKFCDTKERVADIWESTSCAHCGGLPTQEGYDPCIANLPGVMNACCGHGDRNSAYIQFEDGMIIRGFDVVEPPNE